MSMKPTEYDPNACDMYEGCGGRGTDFHSKHTLAALPLTKLMGAILSHCGDEISPVLSCMCCHYAREIGRRGTFEGLTAHKNAVEHAEAYWDKKYGKEA